MKLHYRRLGGYKYQLLSEYSLAIDWLAGEVDRDYYRFADGVLTAKQWYAWDGPSGPTFDSECSLRASLVHDVLYQMMREGELSLDFRPEADELFRALCIEDGMAAWRARLWHRFVRWFGGKHAAPLAAPPRP